MNVGRQWQASAMAADNSGVSDAGLRKEMIARTDRCMALCPSAGWAAVVAGVSDEQPASVSNSANDTNPRIAQSLLLLLIAPASISRTLLKLKNWSDVSAKDNGGKVVWRSISF